MGQAAVDLPDPAQQADLDALPSADDLLAKMAGEEIDRLLAEADVEPPKSASSSADADVVPASAVDGPESAAAPQAAERATSPTALSGLEPHQSNAADPEINRQLDDLFNDLNASPVPSVADGSSVQASSGDGLPPQVNAAIEPTDAGAAGAAPAAESPAGGVAAAVAAPVIDVADQTGPLERATLTPAEPAIEASAAQSDAPADPAGSDDAGLPALLVRVLEWINLPLAGLKDEMRNLMGKIAILTLIHALALLVYALLFR
jgi:hypothetical protein